MTSHNLNLSHPKYRPDIDGLRAIAVILVVAFHAFPKQIKGGFIGVDIFFVISGFLISTIIFQNLDKGTFSFSEFYSRRIKRIFPALALVLAASFVFGWFNLLADEMQQLGKHIAAGAGFISNFVLWNETGYFDTEADYKPLLHLWSLGIEEQFYIIWPVIVWLTWKRKLNALWIILLFIIISFTLNVTSVHQNPTATFYSPLTRFWELLFGSLLAYLNLYYPKTHPSHLADKNLNNIFSIVGAIILLTGILIITKENEFPGIWALLPVLGAFFLIAAGPEAWVNRKFLSNKTLVWIGIISFPLYLWHWPIFSFIRIINQDVPKVKIRIPAILLSVLLAWLTVKFIEKPIRYSNKNNTLKVTLLCGFLALIGTLGFIVYKSDLSKSHKYENLLLKRRYEHIIGSSYYWYEGKDNWLFLGEGFDKPVSKLKLSTLPPEKDIETATAEFTQLADVASKYNIPVVFILGPSKEIIYPEFLPDSLEPSKTKYSSFFLNKLRLIPNLTVYDPTEDFIRAKQSEGILYWRTDTHWNQKGAFIAFKGFANKMGFPIPEVDFALDAARKGDLMEISKQPNYPISEGDNWKIVWKDKPTWTRKEITTEKETPFGLPSITTNNNAPLDKNVWVVGDSFSGALTPFFNAIFRETYYVGHWRDKLTELDKDLAKAEKKPDLIIIVRIERSF